MNNDEQPNVLEFERDLWELEERQRKSRTFQQIFQIYAVLGALVGVSAIAFFFFRKIRFDLSTEDGLILSIAASGFLIAIFSSLFLFFKNQSMFVRIERDRYLSVASDFLVQWARFESLGRSKLERLGEDFNRLSIREIIAKLISAKVLTIGDLVAIEEALRFRNLLVHGGSRVDPEHLARMTSTIRHVVERLEEHTNMQETVAHAG